MSDVQVSNARRIIFTGLALVAFVVTATGAYWASCDWWFGPQAALRWESRPPSMEDVYLKVLPVAAGGGILPWMFLSLSSWNELLRHRVREPWLFTCTLMFVSAIGFSYWLGGVDAVDAFATISGRWDVVPDKVMTLPLVNKFLAQARLEHTVSWLWLLLPLILTTAFVIVGAWKIAMRDAEVEAVDEDE